MTEIPVKAFNLTVYRCPHGHHIISLDDNTGHGIRLNGSKCCGDYRSIAHSWPMTEHLLSEAIIAFENAVEDMQE
jgi:hypothetical protein